MKKRFNVTGNCFRHRHYMMDNSEKIAKAMELVEYGHYFSIHRPRQYGKTTTLFAMEEILKKSEEYFPIKLNFQGIDQKWHESDSAFAQMFMQQLANTLKYTSSELYNFVKEQNWIENLNTLSDFITDLTHFSPKKLVLLIDEVDASSNFMPFLSFLGMLRTKYLDRESPQHFTFHAVVLVGVHDIKSLKYKIRNQEEAQYNSPWNIAIDFDSDMEFKPHEIAPMLLDYSQAENVQMDIEAISQKLYFYTGGYPFLISRLCQIVVDKILPKKEKQDAWTEEYIEEAVQLIYNEVNTNFESLIKNLENHADLYELVYDMLVEGETVPFNPHNSTIRKGVTYGVFKQNGQLKIHNQIYKQIIYNYLISNERKKAKDIRIENQFIQADKLNFERILQRFQVHNKELYNSKQLPFLEKEWRLIFLAFLKPIVNGRGYFFIEPEISEERRLDVAVIFGQNKYVVELKRWYGQAAHQAGLLQLADYLEKQGLEEGYLLIFDHRRETVWQEEWTQVQGKRIFAVWV